MYKIACIFVAVVLQQAASTPYVGESVCPMNEEFLECGPSCPQTCDARPSDFGSPDTCTRGCFCRTGYVRHTDGTCRQESRVCCPRNEIFACGSACQNECARLGQRCPVHSGDCVEACYCIEGYARNAVGVCIAETRCPQYVKKPSKNPPKHPQHGQQACKRNEEYKKRGNPCQATCANRNLPSACRVPHRSGCYCKEGFLYNDTTGTCVKPSNC